MSDEHLFFLLVLTLSGINIKIDFITKKLTSIKAGKQK